MWHRHSCLCFANPLPFSSYPRTPSGACIIPNLMRISFLAAVAANGVIGRDNKLPWHLSNDLKRLKALSMGHYVIMGRKTFDEIGPKPLPGRPHIIVSRSPIETQPNVTAAFSVEDA